MIILRQENGSSLRLDRELANGGEGKIYAINGNSHQVAKIYHQPTPEKAAKLQVMLANPPHDPTRQQQGHISIAWPTERILDTQGRCVGFLMPYIDAAHSFPLLKLYNPWDRRRTKLSFTWEYLLRMARNLASVLAALHKKGYVVGDLNESNVLVTTTALVTLVDCDSIQVPQNNRWVFPWNRRFFRCSVGKPEYTPPELQGCDFSQVNRAVYHDNFGLAVLIFLLLMEGRHPFSGVWQETDEPLTLEQNIQAGNSAYMGTGTRILTLPKHALPFDTLPPSLQRLMVRCFVTGNWYPRWRPTARWWYRALKEAENHLAICNVNGQHVYSQHLHQCPWCHRTRYGIPDPFPPMDTPTRRLPHRAQSAQVERVSRLVLLFAILALYAAEILIWYLYPHRIEQWLHQVSTVLTWLFWLSVVTFPVVLSSVLYVIFERSRHSRRVRHTIRTRGRRNL